MSREQCTYGKQVFVTMISNIHALCTTDLSVSTATDIQRNVQNYHQPQAKNLPSKLSLNWEWQTKRSRTQKISPKSGEPHRHSWGTQKKKKKKKKKDRQEAGNWQTTALHYLIVRKMTLIGAIWDFSLFPRCVVNCPQHVRSRGQGAMVCTSCATHWTPITCYMVCATWYEGTAWLFSLTELESHLA